jgi:hypothetical protein
MTPDREKYLKAKRKADTLSREVKLLRARLVQLRLARARLVMFSAGLRASGEPAAKLISEALDKEVTLIDAALK